MRVLETIVSDAVAGELVDCGSRIAWWRGDLYRAAGNRGLLRIRGLGRSGETMEVLDSRPMSFVIVYDGELFCGFARLVETVAVFEKTERRVLDPHVFRVVE